MTADDLERRAIIAAHDAECIGGCDVTVMPSLNKREEAIVEAAWRADRDDYQGRYETSHDSRMQAEKRLDDMTREARLSRESTEKAVARAKRAEAAIQRVRSLLRDWEQCHDWSDGHCHEGYRLHNDDDCESDCLHCAAAGVRWMLDHAEEAADG